MEMKTVQSSNLNAVGYEPESSTLRVEFKNGGVYDYSDVPAGAHAELMEAPSPGSFYAAQIRKQYDSKKVCATCSCEIEQGVKGHYCGGDSCGIDASDCEAEGE